ncbi:MAG: aminotransferase class I/II-fold pyridoxal phosphate-dependent enzyme [Prevotella sp.]|nr:aminotransferase class I/II-fold pyridoxal phosphate-dependent enzyme [Prevotella sp.]
MTNWHGDDIYRYDNLVKMNFSSTTWQHADHSALKEHLMERFQLVNNYPEPQPQQLERLIASKLGISPNAVMVTNGATEAIHLIARLFHHSASIIPQPTYSEYANACRINKHIISSESSEELLEMPKDRVYWICNPNTPSGNVLMKGFVDYVVRRSPRYTFVVDQSLEAYTREPLLVPSEVQTLSNLIVLHSIGKTYGVPGLRLGYITAHPSTIQLLRQLQSPWPINVLAAEAGKFLISKGQPAITDLDGYLQETERLRTALRKVAGVRVFETKTSYMLCELMAGTSTGLKDYLIHQHGILIRDCQNFDGLTNRLFRVSTQLPEENDTLVAAIQQYMNGLNAQ